jgi:hypothetical protein
VLKIIKHCRENLPELVTGQLLGLDVNSTLEVTNSFPFPQREEEASVDEAESGAKYSLGTHTSARPPPILFQSANKLLQIFCPILIQFLTTLRNIRNDASSP